MALVDYSGSDESEAEEKPKALTSLKSRTNPSKPAFQKLVDSSNPSKIRITLPDETRPSSTDADEVTSPPSKKVKTGPSSFSGFNSFLPAPKRSAGLPGGAANTRGIGLAKDVSLKTGAAPAFSREHPAPFNNDSANHEEEIPNGGEASHKTTKDIEQDGAKAGEDAMAPSSTNAADLPKKKSTIFKPLSVSRKVPKKSSGPHKDHQSKSKILSKDIPPTSASPMSAATRSSLFSIPDTYETSSDATSATPSSKNSYEPLLYQESAKAEEIAPIEPTDYSNQELPQYYPQTQEQEDRNGAANTLTAIASDLNLSASARRQLLGRHGSHQSHNSHNGHNEKSAIKVVNFNTDDEYAANELLRQNGETVQHNPVRAIAPGKHSLKQLVNMATNQQDALEESFAAGRRNKSEAGKKYGW